MNHIRSDVVRHAHLYTVSLLGLAIFQDSSVQPFRDRL